MNIKPIIWKEYNGNMLGFVGGMKLFEYYYDGRNNNFKLITGLPHRFFHLSNREDCEKMAQSLLAKFANTILE